MTLDGLRGRNRKDPHGAGHGHTAFGAEGAFLHDPQPLPASVAAPRVVVFVAADHAIEMSSGNT